MSNLYYCKYFPEGVDEHNFLLPDARPHWPPSRDMMLTHVYLDLDLDLQARRLQGAAHVSFSCIKKKMESIFLEAREFRIEGATTGDGRPLRYRQSDGGVRVYLAEPLAQEEEGVVRLDYVVEDPRLGLYFTGPDVRIT